VTWDGDTVVLLCVKGHQTAAALDDLAAHAPAGTVVVSAQNGIANESAILRLFEATYGICVMLPATHLEPGVVVQKCHRTPGILDLGRVPDGVDATAEAIAADLRSAGFESVPRPDIMAWKRRKLLMNLGNAVDATCRPGDAATELEELARTEGEQVYAAAGLACVSSAEDKDRRDDLQVPLGGSTFQSLSRGTNTEADLLNGEIVLLGRLYGVPTPVNALLQETCRVLARDGAPPRSMDAADLLARLS
jgi:2-dehydropantoate 2-reductase